MSYQSITIVGNVGRDPEMRYIGNGTPTTAFSVATSRKYTASSGEQVEETVWFRVTTWGKQAEICNQYLKKGSKVLVEGRMTPDKETGGPRVWNATDGTPRASFEVTANTVRFLSSRDSGQDSGQQSRNDFAPLDDDENIPF